MIKGEMAAQIALFEWVRYKYPTHPFIHIGNERKCTPQQGALLKRMGVRAGVADIFMPRGNGLYNGLFIELKVGKNKLSDAQRSFLIEMQDEGYMACVAVGLDEAMRIIDEFYQKPCF